MNRFGVCLFVALVLSVTGYADSLNVRTVGYYDTPGSAVGVAVSGGGYAYVADSDSGLRIINISDPGSPTETGFYVTPCVCGVAIQGNYAYLAAGDNGLRIVNISNPANPIEVGFYDTPGYAYEVVISAAYAYVADGDTLRIINISNPASPTEIGHCGTPGTGSAARGVDLVGNYAYVADGDSCLRIVDITNPASPAEIGFYSRPSDWATGVAVADSYAYVADGLGALQIIKVSNPTAPTFINCQSGRGQWANKVVVSGNYAYVTYGTEFGLQIIDISNPDSTFEAGYYDTPGFAYGVAVSGYIYVADGSFGLRIYQAYGPAGVANDQVHTESLKSNYLKLRAYGSTIEYSLPQSGITSIKIYNLLGQEVRSLLNEDVSAGLHNIVWNGRDAGNRKVSSGVYIVQLQSGNQTASAKMLVVR